MRVCVHESVLVPVCGVVYCGMVCVYFSNKICVSEVSDSDSL